MIYMHKRDAIALLVTMFFIIAISVTVGVGLKQVKESSAEVQNMSFMIQANLIIDDILRVLKESKELEEIDSSEALFAFLNQNSFTSFHSNDTKVFLKIQSAKSKFNINALSESNNSVNIQRVALLREFLDRHFINGSFVDILLDMMSGYREDMLYNSNIFDTKPTLFRDYITSSEHLDEAVDYYISAYHDNLRQKIDFTNLFNFSEDKNSSIDLNHVTTDVWSLILSCDGQRAKELARNRGTYTKVQDLELNEIEKENLLAFRTTFFEPVLSVSVEVLKNNQAAKFSFEYDIKTKKGTNFIYEI